MLFMGAYAQSSSTNSFNFIEYSQGNNNITDFEVYYGSTYVTVFSYIGYNSINVGFANPSPFYIHFINKMYGGFVLVGLGNVTIETTLEVSDQHVMYFHGMPIYYRLITNGQYSGILLSKNNIESSDGSISISSITPFFIYYQTVPVFGNVNLENYFPVPNGITFNISNNYLENIGIQYSNFSVQPLNKISFDGELEEDGYLMKSDSQILTINNGASPNIEVYNLLGNVSISLNPGFSLVPLQLKIKNNNSYNVPIFGNLLFLNSVNEYFDIMFGNLSVGSIIAPENSIVYGNNITVNSPFSSVYVYLYNLGVSSSGIPIPQTIFSNEVNSMIFIGNDVSILPFNNSYVLNYTKNQGTLNIHIFQGSPGYIIVGISKFLKINSLSINGFGTNYSLLYTTQNATFYKISAPYEGELNISVVYTNQIELKVHDLFNSFLLIGIVLIFASVTTISIAYYKHIKAAKRIIMK